MHDTRVFIMDLPHSIRGFSRKNRDGSHSIILNAHMNYETQLNTYQHEIEHIIKGDYNNYVDVDYIEAIRHKEGGK